jgi:hypothetical protein
MPRSSLRPVLIYALTAIVVVAGAYLVYELGRHQGGYAMFDVRRELSDYQERLQRREQAVALLERQVALLETSRDIDRATYAQVESNLSSLQARIQAQQEELEFYRGIVSPDDGVAGLRVQGVEASRLDREGEFVVKLVLVQAIVHSQEVSGAVSLRLTGVRNGEPAEYGIRELATERSLDELDYGFRYFQGLEVRIRLPDGFEAERLLVDVVPSEPRAEPVTHEFSWSDIMT